MKNISTGAGLAILGLGIAVHPLLSGVAASATASASTAPATAAIASATAAQAGPTVVWMGVTSFDWYYWQYHRLWSDGRMEVRHVGYASAPDCGANLPTGCGTDWVEVPPPPGGNGFACRTDINGDRKVDGSDLSFVLNAWGQEGGCEPEATYPCLDLGNLAGGVALK
jgi:hypothetical protein